MENIRITVEIDPQYNRRNKPNKKGEYPVYIMIRKGSKKASIKPYNLPSIPLSMFNPDRYGKWISKKHPKHEPYNKKILRILVEIEKYVDSKDVELTPKNIHEWYVNNFSLTGSRLNFNDVLFIDYADEYINKIKNASSRSNLFYTLEKFKKYKTDVKISQMDRQFFEGLAEFFKEKANISESSASAYFQRVKSIFNSWVEKYDHENSINYERLYRKISFNNDPEKEKKFLRLDQLKTILNLELEPGSMIEKVRDIFVFMCYTSRSFKELKSMTFEKNVRFQDGDPNKPIFINKRTKKGEATFYNILVNEKHREIFEKHHIVKSGELFPEIHLYPSNPNAQLNEYLGKIAELAGIEFKLTGRVARYTFRNAVSYKLDSKTRADFMGHKNTSTQDIYNAVNQALYTVTENKWDEL